MNSSETERLRDLLARYVRAYPAFRSKPIGAPHSIKRAEQDDQIALEDDAIAALGFDPRP